MTKRKQPTATRANTPKRARTKKERGARLRSDGGKQPKTKTAVLLALLTRTEGATLEELQTASCWQPHSVRGFLAGTVKKMPGVSLSSEKTETGLRRYRVQRASA